MKSIKTNIITAQDIGALAMMEKLTRIWLPAGTPRENIDVSLDGNWNRELIADLIAKGKGLYDGPTRQRMENDRSSCFQFSADRGDDTCFSYHERHNSWALYSTDPFPSDEEEPGYKSYGYMGRLSFDDEWDGIFRADLSNRSYSPHWRSYQKRSEFTAKWLSFFRRNLWLCGCDIECTYHERIEWIQDWTDKEIEAWQLEV